MASYIGAVRWLQGGETYLTRTITFWDTPRRPVITHINGSHQILSQNKMSKLHI